ncbi:hypothetical protein [Pseudosulfitobacter sp. DSM 107133]|uniref:hypothetical protein n=1 Tax=Pseudosulfitobacter sp. DSM 107133 TaxID=2883100 RepID=UPI000DF22C66|nr:hypothetical protein [Pseudosulfitobacter sp. DSM 107133]UOA29356.1 hypothetical protein DSM107133_04117 [Pseudosulfitobacter sp. DSM 107133]
MPDETEQKKIIPTEVQRRDGNTINQTAQQIDPAGQHRRDVNANAKGDLNMKQPGDAPAEADVDDEREKKPKQRPSSGS